MAITVPTDISGCLLWLKADADVYSDAGSTAAGDTDTVQEWHDQTANGNDATQSTSGKRPVFRTSQINSLPGIDFDGVDDFLDISGIAATLTGTDQPYSLFIVMQPDLSTAGSLLMPFGLSSSSSDTPLHESLRIDTTDGFMSIVRRDSGGTLEQVDSANSQVSNGTNYIAAEVFTGNYAMVCLNDTPIFPWGDLTVGSLSIDRATLGILWRQSNFNFPFKGLICEVIVYDSALNSPGSHDVLDYLSDRWGMTAGLNLTAENAASALTIPTYDGSNEPIHPGIVAPSSTWNSYDYWMAMTPYPNFDQTKENPSIVASNDKTTWEVPTGLTNPIDPAPGGSNHNSDSELLLAQDDNLYCYYRETDASSNDFLRVRSSSDGTTWGSETALFSAAFGELLSPAVIWDGSQYVMWYVDSSTNPNTLRKRTSANPDSGWSAASACTFPAPSGFDLWHMDIVLNGSVYEMLATITLAGTSGPGALMFATSNDGDTWTLDPLPFLYPIAGAWDANRIYRSSGVPTAGGYDLWYSADDSDVSPSPGIAYVSATDTSGGGGGGGATIPPIYWHLRQQGIG